MARNVGSEDIVPPVCGRHSVRPRTGASLHTPLHPHGPHVLYGPLLAIVSSHGPQGLQGQQGPQGLDVPHGPQGPHGPLGPMGPMVPMVPMVFRGFFLNVPKSYSFFETFNCYFFIWK